MTFESINKKLSEVGLKFSEPTIKRVKNKWHFELRIQADYKTCVNGFIHYLDKEKINTAFSIGRFYASGGNLNKLVSILFERIKSEEAIFSEGNYTENDGVVWTESMVTWDEVEKKFNKKFVRLK